jgi:hypothetical protein
LFFFEAKRAFFCQVIYWREVPGDPTFESPITPHHGEHHETYIAYAYDQGGWNNIRMGIEVGSGWCHGARHRRKLFFRGDIR